MNPAPALIAEDEPLLAASLRSEFAQRWPERNVVATVSDGASTVSQALALRPTLCFLNICMPALTGLEPAQGGCRCRRSNDCSQRRATRTRPCSRRWRSCAR